MAGEIKVLLLEDSPQDAELAVRQLEKSGLRCVAQRVDTEDAFRRALRDFVPDVVVSDFSLPRFDGMTALAVVRNESPDVPFIFVSGTIGEERAIEALKQGATDYVLKGNLARLTPTVTRALADARQRAAQRRLEEELRETQSRLESIVSSLHDVVWSVSASSGQLVFVNRAVEEVYGYPVSEVQRNPDLWISCVDPEDRARVNEAWRMALRGNPYETEYRIVRADGQTRWLHARGHPIFSPEGSVVRIDGIATDITARKQQEERIARLTRIHQVLSGINSAIVRIRDRSELLNEACRIAVQQGGFGMAWVSTYDPETMDVSPVAWAGIDASEYAQSKTTARADVPLGQGVVGRAIRSKTPVTCNDMAAEPDVGSVKRREALNQGYRSNIALPLYERDAVAGVLTLYAKEPNFFTEDEIKLLTELAGDISFALDSMAKEEKLNYLAYYDALTGTANRNLLNDRLAQAVVQAHRYGHTVAVAVLNLDHFKLVNDSLGHTAGDELLKSCVERIRSCVRETDTLARFGGDEFVLVLPDQSDPSATSRVVRRVAEAVSTAPVVVKTLQRVLKSISEPITVAERELSLTCSIGVSLYPQDGNDADTLLRNAAAALSRAKQLGRKNYQFYTSELNSKVAERLSLHSSLRRALERDEFTLHYQPKISLQSGNASGSEALLRWNKPGTGMVSPAEFIPVLEETGLIIDVGRWVMEKAVSTYRQWKTRHPQPPRISVNVSQLQLAQKDFAAVVEQILNNAEHGPVGLDFEITESLIMHDLEANVAKLKAIRQMGAEIAIDDFGTGHSSLSYLARLPVDILKIDRAFIAEMDTSPDSLAIVTSIISLAHSLGLKVVAEGVETEAQVKILRLLRCDEIQGYVISRPLPEDQFEAWWTKHCAESEASKGQDRGT